MKTVTKLTALFLLMFVSCDSSSTEGFRKLDNTGVALANGATALQDGNYDDAVEHFETAIRAARTSSSRSSAQSGLGYALLRQSSENKDAAFSRFTQALSSNEDNLDALAGKALMEFSFKDNLTQAIADAEAVLAADASFEMSLDAAVNAADLLLVIAMAHMMNEDYSDALSAVQRISGQGDFTADTSSVSGQLALASKIDQLLAANDQ